MTISLRKSIGAAGATAAVAVGSLAMAGPAQADQWTEQAFSTEAMCRGYLVARSAEISTTGGTPKVVKNCSWGTSVAGTGYIGDVEDR